MAKRMQGDFPFWDAQHLLISYIQCQRKLIFLIDNCVSYLIGYSNTSILCLLWCEILASHEQ